MGTEVTTRTFPTVLLAAVLYLSPLLYVDSLFQPSDLPRWFMIALAGPLALGWLALTDTRFQFGAGSLLTLLLLGWSAITITWSPEPGAAYVIWMQWLSVALCAFAVAQSARSAAFLWTLVTASVAGGALVALIGALENFGVPSPYRDALVAGATFYVKNHAALYLDAIAPVALGACFLANDRRLRWFFAIAAGLTLGYLLMSRTRGSWLALLVIAVAALWACRHFRWPWREASRRARNPLIAAVCIALAIAAWPGEIAKVWSRPIEGYTDHSSRIRLIMYADTMPIIAEHPLAGVGLNGWPQHFRDHYLAPVRLVYPSEPQEQRTHSDPLQLLAELGIPGGLLALALLALPLRRLWSMAKQPPAEDDERGLRIALGFGLLAVAVHAMIDFPLHKPSSLLQYAVWSALVMGASPGGRSFVVHAQARTVAVVLSLFLFVVAIRDHLRFFEGSALTLSATGAFASYPLPPTPCPEALRAADDAVGLFPEYFAAHMERVRVHAKCSDDNTLIAVMTDELAHNPTNVEALRARGRAWLRKGEFDLAEADFRAVLTRFDYDVPAWAALAELYRAKGETRAAQEAQAKADSLDKFSRPEKQKTGVIAVPKTDGKL